MHSKLNTSMRSAVPLPKNVVPHHFKRRLIFNKERLGKIALQRRLEGSEKLSTNYFFKSRKI